ncbi:MAG TPA: hypothetical protein PK514_01835 [Spirochaetota bacterium]|nr:hypothetical protein [Spirochaetota bacterium]
MRIKVKNIFSLLSVVIFTLSFTTLLHAEAFKSPSLGGATGLIATPTSHTGWEGSGLGLDVAAHYVNGNDYSYDHGDYTIYKALLHLGLAGTNLEFGFAYDDQPDWGTDDDTDDMILNAKWEFTEGLAIGGNAQLMNINGVDEERNDYQLYFAATYPGDFFSMPAETTIVIGHTFWGDDSNEHDDENIDFSMGFDLDFAPSIFKHYVHWISDFANYSYSTEPGGANSEWRGAFNTGLRFALMRDKQFKFNLDLIVTDALDDNRDWAAGAAFGMSL